MNTENITTAPEIIERPTTPIWYGKRRAPDSFYKPYWRACWVYDLATHAGGIATPERIAAASTMINAVNRYAIADANQWERANDSSNERYANSKQCERDEAALERRRASINKRLETFGAHLEYYGLYPTISDANNNRVCSY